MILLFQLCSAVIMVWYGLEIVSFPTMASTDVNRIEIIHIFELRL